MTQIHKFVNYLERSNMKQSPQNRFVLYKIKLQTEIRPEKNDFGIPDALNHVINILP